MAKHGRLIDIDDHRNCYTGMDGEYENWNIDWGLRGYGRINDQWHLFGEFNIRPAGSMSQLASKYEFSQKFGLKYVW